MKEFFNCDNKTAQFLQFEFRFSITSFWYTLETRRKVPKGEQKLPSEESPAFFMNTYEGSVSIVLVSRVRVLDRENS